MDTIIFKGIVSKEVATNDSDYICIKFKDLSNENSLLDGNSDGAMEVSLKDSHKDFFKYKNRIGKAALIKISEMVEIDKSEQYILNHTELVNNADVMYQFRDGLEVRVPLEWNLGLELLKSYKIEFSEPTN